LHRERLTQLQFRHHGFEIDYAPGRKRGATRNAVSWLDDQGRTQRAVIGDHVPLVLDGHRFYTSPNKGFAPVLTWQPDSNADGSVHGEARSGATGSTSERGAVHLPSYPMHELSQSRAWTLPDGREVWVMLSFDEALIPPGQAGRFRLPEVHRLIVRIGNERQELAPGEAARLHGGTLTYEGLSTWMGYRVAYDPTLPWLLAAALLAAFALLWHYIDKFRGAARGEPVVKAHAAPSLEWADG
jgi:cytochrome c biogenesis protein